MSPAVIAAIAWALAATATALLPFRHQFIPGVALLVAAPALIGWIGASHGWLPALLGLAAFLSMFRKPLFYFARRAMGLPVTRPDRTEAPE